MVSKCENFTEEEDGGYFQLTSWWIESCTQDVVIVIGIIGNILICVVLLQKHLWRNTFNQLRVALAFFDIILLITTFLTYVLFRSAEDILQIVYPIVLWPSKSFSKTICVFMTVTMAWERYGAINNPYTYKSYEKYRAMKYVSSLIVVAMVLNIGKFLELQPTQCVRTPGFTGLFKLGKIFKNNIIENNIIAIYNTVIFKILIGGVLPVTMLTYLYGKIFLKMQQHKQTMASQNATVKKKIMQEQRMAITFVGVVISLLVCITPGWLIVFKVLMDGTEATNLQYYEIVIMVRMAFYTLNSATNIFIYICLDTIFRKELKMFFKCAEEADNQSTSNV